MSELKRVEGERMKEQKKGIILGLVAYVLWGIIPLYWKLLPTVNSMDILCYRIVWSFLFMGIYILITKRGPAFMQEVTAVLKDKKKVIGIIVAAILISIN